MRWYPYQIRIRQQLTENDFQRRFRFSNWFIRMCQNNRFLPNIVIEDEACFFMDGTVNTYNIRMYATKGNKPDFTFQINNSHQKVTVWGGICGKGILLGPCFFERNVNGGNYLEILTI